MNEIGRGGEHTRFRAGAGAVEPKSPTGRVERSEKGAAPRPLSHAELIEKLHFDERTGVFRWRIDVGGRHRNRIKAGSVAGNLSHDYRLIGINGRQYTASRLAHFYVHAEWPAEDKRLPSDPAQALAGKPIRRYRKKLRSAAQGATPVARQATRRQA